MFSLWKKDSFSCASIVSLLALIDSSFSSEILVE